MNAFLNFFSNTDQEYQNVDCGELEQLLADGSTENMGIIDVRTEMEHASGHIPHSSNINLMHPEFARKLDVLDRDKTYYVYCASGNRSRTACSQMKRMGFEKVFNVRMGMMGWSGEIE